MGGVRAHRFKGMLFGACMLLIHAKIQIQVKLKRSCDTELLFTVTEVQYCLAVENK